jgi:nucleoside-diphosphate-sugar epimerase
LESFREVNVRGTASLLEACVENSVKRFVYVSSVAVHSFIDAQDMDEQSPQLPTPFPYCQSKREAEVLVLAAHKHGKVAATIVRPGDLYGPGDRVALLRMVGLLEAGALSTIGDGGKLGAFTYVENLVDGLILAGTTEGAAGEAYIITDGIKLTWREYLERLTSAVDVPEPCLCVPPALAYAAASVLEFFYRLLRVRQRPPITRYLVTHLTNDFHFSIDKARHELGYEPHVGIDEAIERTAEWYKRTVRGE